ncbi:hypothetical protein BDQ12DRAFT_671429 [Crucibulum laeve]|uniref:Uncharacterized protein n=1 Tax=Crucibulum laeve TaxID=68775 RepID=A0A5C3LGJ5_9AGAR|nr:hypothetical protein BDQ12DRAFT_671429 [Crucibulum laeve]
MPPPLTTTFEGFEKNGIANKGIWVTTSRYLRARKGQKMEVLNNELVIDDQDRYSFKLKTPSPQQRGLCLFDGSPVTHDIGGFLCNRSESYSPSTLVRIGVMWSHA